MAAHGYVGEVGSDGEDAIQRMVCSGAVLTKGAEVIAVGYSTDPYAVFEDINSNFAANQALYSGTAYTNLSVGYSNGYWMIVISE